MSYQYVLHTIPHLVEIKPGWLSAQGEPAQHAAWVRLTYTVNGTPIDSRVRLETGDAWLSVCDQTFAIEKVG